MAPIESETPVNLCPSCSYANPAHASFCNACGFALVVRCPHCAARNDASSPTCRECGTALAPGQTGHVRLPLSPSDASGASTPPSIGGEVPRLPLSDALWTDDGAMPSRAEHTFVSEGPTLNLLDLGDPNAPPDMAPGPSQSELVRSDPEPAFPAPIAAEPPAIRPPPGTEDAAPAGSAAATSKAEHRAAVRRARMARQLPADRATTGPPDVLVLDENDAARAQLCGFLEAFGFEVHPARDPAEARVLLASHGFVAVFLGVALDGTEGDDAAELCRRIKQPARRRLPEVAQARPPEAVLPEHPGF